MELSLGNQAAESEIKNFNWIELNRAYNTMKEDNHELLQNIHFFYTKLAWVMYEAPWHHTPPILEISRNYWGQWE